MSPQTSLRRLLAIATIVFGLPLISARADDTASQPPEKIWQRLQDSFLQLDAPAAWRTNPPAKDIANAWRAQKLARAAELADQAKDFYTRYAGYPQAPLARQSEYNLLEIAVENGNTNLAARLGALDDAKLRDLLLTDDERFALAAHIVERNANSHQAEGNAAVMAALEKGSREFLLKRFPENPQSWQFLVTVADQSADPKHARRVAGEILAGNAGDDLKLSARRILKRLDRLGKPVTARFTAMDGSVVDFKKLRGRVVLLHFWDTWCGYCVEELPNLKAVYGKRHGDGFEIVSVSFDQEKSSLDEFLAKDPLPWPQYFAGKNWDATFSKQFDVPALPTLWLVDKKGRLRELNAREGLAAKVDRLLAE